MALQPQVLSLWEIAHRWNNIDPEFAREPLPRDVKDTARRLIEAIILEGLHGLVFYPGDKQDGSYSEIEHVSPSPKDELQKVLEGKPLDYTFLEMICIDRDNLSGWCLNRGLERPPFWFPEDQGPHSPGETIKASIPNPDPDTTRASTNCRIACAVVADQLWKENPTTTIADMVKHHLLQHYCGARHYSEDTVRKWIKEVAPPTVRVPGRPRKPSE